MIKVLRWFRYRTARLSMPDSWDNERWDVPFPEKVEDLVALLTHEQTRLRFEVQRFDPIDQLRRRIHETAETAGDNHEVWELEIEGKPVCFWFSDWRLFVSGPQLLVPEKGTRAVTIDKELRLT